MTRHWVRPDWLHVARREAPRCCPEHKRATWIICWNSCRESRRSSTSLNNDATNPFIKLKHKNKSPQQISARVYKCCFWPKSVWERELELWQHLQSCFTCCLNSSSILISFTAFLLHIIASGAAMLHPVFQLSTQLLQTFRLGLVDSFVLHILRLRHRPMIRHDTIVIHHLIRACRCVRSIVVGGAPKDRRTRPWVVVARQLFPERRARRLICRYWDGVGRVERGLFGWIGDTLITKIPELITLFRHVSVTWRCNGWVWLTNLLLFLILLLVGGVGVFFDGVYRL